MLIERIYVNRKCGNKKYIHMLANVRIGKLVEYGERYL